MKTHTELLNYLAAKHNLISYLEIGVQDPKNNFDKVNLPTHAKVGVDPCLTLKDNLLPIESDTFFKSQPDTFDLIFIDGNHTKEQAKRDFENSLRCLNDGGFIVIHDTLPENEAGTIVPRETKQWWGDVYKFACKLKEYPCMAIVTIDMDNGCTVVWKENRNVGTNINYDITWPLYLERKKSLLNIIQPSEIGNYF